MSTSQKPSNEELIGRMRALPPPITPPVAEFTTAHFPTFDVEWSIQGNDIIYHFWPVGNEAEFPKEFGLALEEGFKTILPKDADVRASYHDLLEVRVNGITRAYLPPTALWVPQPTFWVRVVGWINRPGARQFLTREVFAKIHEAAQRRHRACS